MVSAVVVTEDQNINEISNKNWSIPFDGLNPDGANDFVVYIKNNGDKVVHVSDFRIMADTTATQLCVHSVTGTVLGGGDVTPVNKTVGASAIPSVTIQTGTDLTGIVSDGILYYIQCAVVNTEYHLRISGKIRIPKGKAVALQVETATANITGTISLVEEE